MNLVIMPLRGVSLHSGPVCFDDPSDFDKAGHVARSRSCTLSSGSLDVFIFPAFCQHTSVHSLTDKLEFVVDVVIVEAHQFRLADGDFTNMFVWRLFWRM
ncbi:unnamed protein product [Protopolystoma xenopodis]|uniref:Uncharacterized protein n=1 Tax=Protopolystoma xenopodis TaxID=117903 RepID=A0A448WN30_9PLAT|nr:unnamed protein product [Protopolystoma xenopodis]